MLSLVTRSTTTAVAAPPRPFTLSPDPRLLFESRSYTTALGDIRDAVMRGEALIHVTGGPGIGKTTMCRGLLAHLDYRTVVSIVMDPCGGIEDFLETVLRDFGLAVPSAARQRHQLIYELQRFLTSLIPLNARALIVVDEAQHLPVGVLEEIRLLLNCQTDSRTLLQVVLVGQPSMSLTPLVEQRVSYRRHLDSLNRDEVEAYVEHRLRVTETDAGVPSAVNFTPTAVRALVRLSGGVPRVVNLLCERALDVSRQRGQARIGVMTVLRGARQVARPASLLRRFANVRRAAALALAIAGAGTTVGATAYWWNGRHEEARTAESASEPTQVPAAAAPIAASAVVPASAPDVETAALSSIDGVVVRGSTGVLGPFLSADEARRAQRGIEQPANTVSASASSETFFQRVAMVRAGGRVSAMIELTAEPRQISTQTLAVTVLDVDLGPLAALPKAQELNAPDGAPLIDHVSIRGVVAEGGPHAKVRLTLWRPATAAVRISGRRIYVDFQTSDADVAMPRPASVRRAAASAPSPAATIAAVPSAAPAPSREAMKAAAARFEEMLPFLMSASKSSPDVLNALSGSLAELQTSVRDITPDTPSRHAHELLSSAIGLATHAARIDFKGDRAAEAKQAAALFTAAQGELGRQ